LSDSPLRSAITLRREGGSPPSDHEVLDIAPDATFELWRTNSRSSRPPSAIGSFAGSVAAPDVAELAAAADVCRSAPALELDVPRGASTETVVVGGSTSHWGDDVVLPEPWAALATVLRRLVGELTSAPRAAVSLDVSSAQPVLRHEGTHPLDLDLSNAKVRAVRWAADGGAAEEWSQQLDGPRSLTADEGWTLELPFGHPWAVPIVVTAHVEGLLAFDGTSWWACSLDQPLSSR
jgi:hypothetical protein